VEQDIIGQRKGRCSKTILWIHLLKVLQRLCFFINLSLHNSLSFSAGFLLTYIKKKTIIIELEIVVFYMVGIWFSEIISLFWLMYWIRHTQQFMSHYSLLPSSKVIHTDINLMMASREFVRLKVGSKKSNWKNKQCACGVHVQKRPRELCLKKECVIKKIASLKM